MLDNTKVTQFKKICAEHNCTLVAVTKKRAVIDIVNLYQKGQKIFGENRALDLRDKAKDLSEDMEWHFIGHLQSNKIKYIMPYVSLIHSVDRFDLLEAVDKQAAKHQKVVNYLLQFHIAEESAKQGFDKTQVQEIMAYLQSDKNPNTQCCGVMGMATFTEDKGKVKQEFLTLKKIFDALKAGHFKDNEDFKEISMGMSGDYELAIEAGSTMLRIGSALFLD